MTAPAVPDEALTTSADDEHPKYALTAGLTYGADWHRYRYRHQDDPTHDHGDALVLLVDAEPPQAEAGAPRRNITWAQALCVGRVAASTNKALALTSEVRQDAPVTFFTLRAVQTLV